MTTRVLISAVVVWLCGCTKVIVENPTDKFSEGKPLAELKNKRLEEISGTVASINNPGFFWVHNDSGNDAEVFLIDDNLKILLTCTIKDGVNRDWEDIAVGPGPEHGKNYLYIAEIGDNFSQYDTKYLYRFEEPVWDKKTSTQTIHHVDTIAFSLDVRKDAEAIFLDHQTKDLYVISKRDEPVWLYRLPFPQPLNETIVAEKLISLPFTRIVAADLTPDGKQLLMKNYEHIYYWERKPDQSLVDMLSEKPFEVPYTIEPQGESITWARDLSGFYTLSEKNKGKSSYLYFYKKEK